MSPACTVVLIVDYKGERFGMNNFAWCLMVELGSLLQRFSKSVVLGGIFAPNFVFSRYLLPKRQFRKNIKLFL